MYAKGLKVRMSYTPAVRLQQHAQQQVTCEAWMDSRGRENTSMVLCFYAFCILFRMHLA
jgi:hypothetical protein